MIVAAALAIALAYLFVGLVLHRGARRTTVRLTVRRIGGRRTPRTRRLVLGILPAIALIGSIGTYLALFDLFRADITSLGAWRSRLVAMARCAGHPWRVTRPFCRRLAGVKSLDLLAGSR